VTKVERLIEGVQRLLGLTLTPRQCQAFQLYYQELVTWNAHFNLTAITDLEGIQIRHFLDSLSCLLAIRDAGQGQSLIDVGSGAGFPGLPLKIVCPALRLTLLEATGKKTRFLRHLVELLELREVTVIHARAEQIGHDPAHREAYEWVVARAVAAMPTLVEYLLPLCRLGGHCLAQKGEEAAAEVSMAEPAILLLGGRLNRLIPVELSGLAETRHLVTIDKVARTPLKYPRRPGMPAKRPLGNAKRGG
jgi:16S rRNA (guanine527-N7)-methyltransferase